MRMRSSAATYGAVAVAIHWVSALAVFGLLVSGTILDNETDEAARQSLLGVHALVGSAVFVLTIARILWWWLVDVRPADPAGVPAWQSRAARFVHIAFYVALVVMGASGVAMIALSGAADILWFGAPGPLPDFGGLPPRPAHGLMANLLMALIAAHVLAALYHQFVRRDRLLARMGIGRA